MDVAQIKDRAKARVNETRLDKTTTDNERLRAENVVLRNELDRATKDRTRFIDALERMQPSPAPKRHRMRRVMTIAVAAAGAYVAGTKAGRERYEQIRSWWDQTRDRGKNVVTSEPATATIDDDGPAG